MVLVLMLSLISPPPAAAGVGVGRPDGPPIKVWLNEAGSYHHGDRAQVYVRMAEDGYLVVLRADTDGRVRVLFPIEPADNNFLQGNKTLEIRGRGDREAFFVDERNGTGLVLAARSGAPFRFDDFVRGDHWDYAVLDTGQAGGDREAALLEVARRMSVDGHFDYDDVSYTVGASSTSYRSPAPCYGCYSPYYGWPSRFGVGFAFGSGFAFAGSACFGPFLDPFFCDPFFFRPVFFRPLFFDPFFSPVIVQTFVFTPFIFRPFVFTRPFIIRHGLVIIFAGRGFTGANLFVNRVRPGLHGPLLFGDLASGVKVADIRPQVRIPPGALISRAMLASARAPMPVRVRELAATSARTPVPARDGASARAPAPMGVRDRIHRTAPAAAAPTRVREQASVGAPRPLGVSDRGTAAASEPVRVRDWMPERVAPVPVRERADVRANRAIPNARVLERPEVEQGGFPRSERWDGRWGGRGATRAEGFGRGWSAPRSWGSARVFIGRGRGGGRRR